MQVRLVLRNQEKVIEFIKTLPRGVVRVGMTALAEYILGNENRGLRHMEPYKYVSRARAYGQTFQSEKQRKWFFANKIYEKIGNNRTGEISKAWTVADTNNGYGKSFRNKAPGAVWLYSDAKQANQLRMVGHRTVSSKVQSNLAGAIRHAISEIKKYLKNK